MPARPKRSERLKITLTPAQFEKLQLVAKTAKRPPATQAYELVRQGLENADVDGVTDPASKLELEQSVAELYGVLDAIHQQLAVQVERLEPEQEQANFQSLLNEINGRIHRIQQSLLSLPLVGSR